MKHRLDPLLRPRSVAVVGASAREDSMGQWALVNLERGGFRGRIFPVNPGYTELQGHRCYAGLADLPETPVRCEFLFIAESRGYRKLVKLIERATIWPQ